MIGEVSDGGPDFPFGKNLEMQKKGSLEPVPTKSPEPWVFEEDGYRQIPEGRYKVELRRIMEIKDPKDGLRDVYEFSFEILEGEFKGVWVGGLVNKQKRYKIQHKLFQWVRALNPDAKPEEAIDRNSLIGCKCEIYASKRLSSFGRPSNKIDITGPYEG